MSKLWMGVVPDPEATRVLVTDGSGASLLKARLPHACSGPSRTAIPADVGHRFRSMSDSDSGPSRTPDRGRVSGRTGSAEP